MLLRDERRLTWYGVRGGTEHSRVTTGTVFAPLRKSGIEAVATQTAAPEGLARKSDIIQRCMRQPGLPDTGEPGKLMDGADTVHCIASSAGSAGKTVLERSRRDQLSYQLKQSGEPAIHYGA